MYSGTVFTTRPSPIYSQDQEEVGVRPIGSVEIESNRSQRRIHIATQTLPS